MSQRKVVEEYYCDIGNLADLLTKFVNSYRLLIGGAHDLNQVALASKKDIKEAIDRAEDLGDIIDDLIDALEIACQGYMNYCSIKSGYIINKMQPGIIQTEIDEELEFEEK